jgi:hypothetical protein
LRRNLFARLNPYDLDFVQRYAEVLNAATPTADGAAGSSLVPKVIRVFLSEAFLGTLAVPNSWPGRSEPLDGKSLTPEVAITMVQRLGGNLTDFFDALYCQAISGTDLRPAA